MTSEEILREDKFAKITYDGTLDAVRINWKRAARWDDYKQVLQSGLEMVEEKEATNWLADLREMGTVGSEDQDWTNEEWFPRVMRTSLTQMAVVQSERRIQNMDAESTVREVGDVLTHRSFDTIDEAEDWLDA